MHQKLLESVGKTARLKALNVLKRTQGLSVPELSERMGLSYMGTKDICLELEKRGLLECKREPKPEGTTGRPRMVYRLTDRARSLFPTASNPLTIELLDAARRLHGPTAAEKLLMAAWQLRTARAARCAELPTLRERAAALVRLRDNDGHMAELIEEDEGLFIEEHHSPFEDIIRNYPIVARLEAELFKRALGVAVERVSESADGPGKIIYRIPLS